MFVGRLALRRSGRSAARASLEVARAARAAPRPSHPLRAPDLLLDGLAVRFTEGYAAGVPILRRALTAFGRDAVRRARSSAGSWLACVAAMQLWDDGQWDVLSRRHVSWPTTPAHSASCRFALSARAYLELFAGELAAAAALVAGGAGDGGSDARQLRALRRPWPGRLARPGRRGRRADEATIDGSGAARRGNRDNR